MPNMLLCSELMQRLIFDDADASCCMHCLRARASRPPEDTLENNCHNCHSDTVQHKCCSDIVREVTAHCSGKQEQHVAAHTRGQPGISVTNIQNGDIPTEPWGSQIDPHSPNYTNLCHITDLAWWLVQKNARNTRGSQAWKGRRRRLLGREPSCGHESQILAPLLRSYSSRQMAPVQHCQQSLQSCMKVPYLHTCVWRHAEGKKCVCSCTICKICCVWWHAEAEAQDRLTWRDKICPAHT